MLICPHDSHEAEPCEITTVPIGVVSAEPAYLMNAESAGQAIGLKGRVPVRVVGAVVKGDVVYAHTNGTASVNGLHIVGIALETNESQEEKLVECVLKV
jgi:hypothetical protein